MTMRDCKGARRMALVATILLMPGGFVLGGVLLARHVNERRKAKALREKEKA